MRSATSLQTGIWRFLLRPSPGSIVAWICGLVGVLLPWSVGIGTKIYFDLHDHPTWDWLYFLHPARLLFEVWATFWFALPAIALAVLAYFLFTDRIPRLAGFNDFEKSLVILPSLVWGAVGSVPVFLDIFREFHPIVVLIPFFVTFAYVGDYTIGLLAGLVLAICSCAVRRCFHGAHHEKET